jgi:hypothetical protein
MLLHVAIVESALALFTVPESIIVRSTGIVTPTTRVKNLITY